MNFKTLLAVTFLLFISADCFAQAVPSKDQGCAITKTPSEIQSYQDFIVRTFREKDGRGCVQISRMGNILYDSHTDGSYFLLNSADEKSVGGLGPSPHTLPIGTDLTGLGKPELLLMDWSGGAHCCSTFEILELSDQVRLVTSIDGGDSDSAYFSDVLHDGHYEFIGNNYTFAYWHSDFVHSPAPPRILRFDGQNYVLALEAMRKPAPSPETLKKVVAATKTGVWVDSYPPSALTNAMVNLIYSGHSNLAWSIASQSWVAGHISQAVFLQQLCAQLALDPFYPQLRPTLIGAPCKLPYVKTK